MTIKKMLSLGLAVLALSASAQDTAEADRKESEAAAPPAFNKDKLLALEMPPYVSLHFGVDPSTLTITADGIVRYVMVATNATGSVSAMYEGIRCASGEVKVYARSSNLGPWHVIKDPQWQGLDRAVSKHAMVLAKLAACADGTAATARSVEAIVNSLKSQH